MLRPHPRPIASADRAEAREPAFYQALPVAQLCAHVGGVSGPGLPLPPAAVPLPTPKGLGQNRGVRALATDRCRSAGAQGALTSAPCCSCACKGGAWPPRLHTSSCTGSWAGPGDKVIGATPLKKSLPGWTPRSPVAGSPRSHHHG